MRQRLFIFLMSTFFFLPLNAVTSRYNYDEGNSIVIREMRDNIEDIRHELSNHESELRVFDERIKNQEVILESMRESCEESNRANKESVKIYQSDLEGKNKQFDNTLKKVVSDLQQFKTHANESATSLAQYKEKINELEKIIDQQNQNIAHLQAAMQSLVEAVQIKNSKANKESIALNESSKTYKVKNGDNLEKIARQNQTTVKAIKELNGLENDRIRVGQTLLIPES